MAVQCATRGDVRHSAFLTGIQVVGMGLLVVWFVLRSPR